MTHHYADRLANAIEHKRTAAVVGIDPVLERLPAPFAPQRRTAEHAARCVEGFAREVIRVVAPRVPAVKINSAFFEAMHEHGVAVFYRLIRFARECGLLVISDIKRGDIGSTAALYARGHIADPPFEDISASCVPDAVTLAGYLGKNAVIPFVEQASASGRGVYVLVRPSDPGADVVHDFGGERPFYLHMAELVREWGAAPQLVGERGFSCVGAVVAPKDSASTAALRGFLPHTPLLVPGYGAQGGTAAACRACFARGAGGAVVNASRSVIYAFEKPEYREQFGDDWLACIDAACAGFAEDIASLL